MSVGEYKLILKRIKINANQQQKRPRKAISANTRYNEFRVRPHLKLLRGGIDLHTTPEMMRDELTEAHMYHFECTYDHVDRMNKDTPRFFGVLRLKETGVYIFPHDADFRQMYCQRTDLTRCWDEEPDGTPYWTDVYALRMQNKHML